MKKEVDHRHLGAYGLIIKDEKILADIVLNSSDKSISLMALEHITRIMVLANMLKKCNDETISSEISNHIDFLMGMEKRGKLEENEKNRREELFKARNRF